MLKTLNERDEQVHPGDVIMHNDAYGGASHVPDVGFVVPVFHEEELILTLNRWLYDKDKQSVTSGESENLSGAHAKNEEESEVAEILLDESKFILFAFVSYVATPRVCVHCLAPEELYFVTKKSEVPVNVFPSKFPLV